MLGLWDAFPASPNHALLVPKRHVATWFDATAAERRELTEAIDVARAKILERAKVDGWNVGFNVGAAGGQTVFHLHLHVIPRYAGDVPDPRGGVRLAIPAKGNYLADGGSIAREASTPFTLSERSGSAPLTLSERSESKGGRFLTTGGADPLLPILAADLAAATHVDAAIAFVMESGLDHLEPHFEDVLARGGLIRFVAGDYLDVTDPVALRRLLDLKARHPSALDLRIFVSGNRSFHPKTWILRGAHGGVAWVGSSNLSKSALHDGIEWNYRVITARDSAGFASATAAFEQLLQHPSVRPIDAAWIAAYAARRRPPSRPGRADAPETIAEAEPVAEPPAPNEIQVEALAALAATRDAGNEAGLVVLATGLGKTWLAAFDSVAFKRVLFVAHREEILDQARKTFRCIRPDSSIGFYDGEEKITDSDIVFASVQTLGRRAHLDQFPRDAFDYIVVDEFHHASARTYRQLIEHFEPRFLLGLTATPERTDGGDLLALCGENLVFRADLVDGISGEHLVPFHYFGVPDDVEYENIPWKSTRFDEEALTKAVATQARAANVLEQYRSKAGKRTLAFCVSQTHANFMRDYFLGKGIRAVAVHSGKESAARTDSLERLSRAELDVVFAVDMFNEGVDVPAIDTVMMLRPTESRLLWLQQLGRGLRKCEETGKKHLTVVDYIGNHRTFLLKAQTLLALGTRSDIRTDAELSAALKRLDAKDLEFPAGCEVTYELEAKNILNSLIRVPKHDEALKVWYEEFRERHGTRPKAIEAMHDGYNVHSVRKLYGSWLGFVKSMGDLTPEESVAFDSAGEFLRELDDTRMVKSYKMVVLQALLNRNALPGELSLDELTDEFGRITKRSAKLRQDVGPDHENPKSLRSMLLRNPVAAWTGDPPPHPERAKRVEGLSSHFFSLEKDIFRSLIRVPAPALAAFQLLARELVDWRLAEYLTNYADSIAPAGRILIKVNHAGARPILMPLPRAEHASIPEGWTDVTIDGDPYTANFAKVAVNVIRKPKGEVNDLPRILRTWFGPDAGLPGTDHHVVLDKEGDTWRLSSGRGAQAKAGLEIGRAYAREEIPPLFGLKFNSSVWHQGWVIDEKRKVIILLVTLSKHDLQKEHQYEDRFLSDDLLQWQSQNQTKQTDKRGQLIRSHLERGIAVHLFVRQTKRLAGRAAPFIYRGTVTFESWERSEPITVRWRLAHPGGATRGSI